MPTFQKPFLLLFISLIALTFQHCDVVPLSEIEEQNPVDTSIADTNKTYQKNVFVEEFTGHTCGNCPGGAKTLQDLKKVYKDRLVVLAVHSGWFALPKNNPDGSFAADYRTPAGDDLYQQAQVFSLPNGRVDRKEYNGSKVVSPSAWASAVAEYIQLEPKIGLDVSVEYNANDASASVEINATALSALSQSLNVYGFVAEDSVVSWQKDYSQTPQDIADYTHMHLLRKGVSPASGNTLTTGPTIDGDKLKTVMSFSIPKDGGGLPQWRAKNLRFITVVTDAVTGEVLQCDESPVLE